MAEWGRRAGTPLRGCRAALLLALVALASACGVAADDSRDINARFLAPDLDVGEWVERFEGESREIYRSREAIVAALGLAPGMRVADIGAGTGLFMQPFAEAVGSDGRVFANEISPVFLDHLRKRAAATELAQVEVVQGSADATGLAAASVDLIFVCDVYHHFEDPQRMLEDLHRALRPGGALVVIDFERIPGTTRGWIVEHVRADRATFTREITAAGFELVGEPEIEGLSENYLLRFRRP